MQIVEKHIIDRNHDFYAELDFLSFQSKNLYNSINYMVRQEFFASQTILSIQEIYWKAKQSPDYQSLPRRVSGLVVFQVLRNWKAYIEATIEYQTHPEKFKAEPKIPKYKDKSSGRNLLQYDIQAISKKFLKNGLIKLSQTGIIFSTTKKNINQVRIVPRKGYYVIEVVYIVEDTKPCGKYIAAGDIGVNNLIAITSNKKGFQPLVVNGRQLKSINQYYNKKLSILQSKLEKDVHTSKQIQQLSLKRTNKINNCLHLYSRRIVDFLSENEIKTFVIGKNDNWKTSINLGHKINQEFVSIPHARFISILKYKCELAGIELITVSEEYTSMTSFLDKERPIKRRTYSGKRIKRGLFKSKKGYLINADVNGSYQIMKKAFPKAFYGKGIEGVAVHPRRLSEHV